MSPVWLVKLSTGLMFAVTSVRKRNGIFLQIGYVRRKQCFLWQVRLFGRAVKDLREGFFHSFRLVLLNRLTVCRFIGLRHCRLQAAVAG